MYAKNVILWCFEFEPVSLLSTSGDFMVQYFGGHLRSPFGLVSSDEEAVRKNQQQTNVTSEELQRTKKIWLLRRPGG